MSLKKTTVYVTTCDRCGDNRPGTEPTPDFIDGRINFSGKWIEVIENAELCRPCTTTFLEWWQQGKPATEKAAAA